MPEAGERAWEIRDAVLRWLHQESLRSPAGSVMLDWGAISSEVALTVGWMGHEDLTANEVETASHWLTGAGYADELVDASPFGVHELRITAKGEHAVTSGTGVRGAHLPIQQPAIYNMFGSVVGPVTIANGPSSLQHTNLPAHDSEESEEREKNMLKIALAGLAANKRSLVVAIVAAVLTAVGVAIAWASFSTSNSSTETSTSSTQTTSSLALPAASDWSHLADLDVEQYCIGPPLCGGLVRNQVQLKIKLRITNISTAPLNISSGNIRAVVKGPPAGEWTPPNGLAAGLKTPVTKDGVQYTGYPPNRNNDHETAAGGTWASIWGGTALMPGDHYLHYGPTPGDGDLVFYLPIPPGGALDVSAIALVANDGRTVLGWYDFAASAQPQEAPAPNF